MPIYQPEYMAEQQPRAVPRDGGARRGLGAGGIGAPGPDMASAYGRYMAAKRAGTPQQAGFAPPAAPNRAQSLLGQGYGTRAAHQGGSLAEMAAAVKRRQGPGSEMYDPYASNMGDPLTRSESGLFGPVRAGRAEAAPLPRGWPPEGGLPSIQPMLEALKNRDRILAAERMRRQEEGQLAAGNNNLFGSDSVEGHIGEHQSAYDRAQSAAEEAERRNAATPGGIMKMFGIG